MAFTKNQGNSSLATSNGKIKKTAINFLPAYFKTSTNQKFVDATIDRLINSGSVEKINAFIGRTTSRAYVSTDRYLGDISADRQAYQLEPSLVIRDSFDNLNLFQTYSNYINQLKFFNSSEQDHSKLNSQEFYSWNPHIDWDKFVNYREYFWLPTGPYPVLIPGQVEDLSSTYEVTLSHEHGHVSYRFSAGKEQRNPTVRLYRGQTYRFEIDCPGYPLAIKTVRSADRDSMFTNGVTSSTEFVEKGTIEFTVPETAPNILYYVSSTNIDVSGIFSIFDITDETITDVNEEIIGKKSYILPDGTALSNGMKVYFQGNVKPEIFQQGFWYVEGVGKSIELIFEQDLKVYSNYTSTDYVEFDNEQFDSQGFDINTNRPVIKDYITINKGSKDKNHWSRNNRWFHKSVIETSAALAGQPAVLDQTARAVRPIIEFLPNIKLYKFGTCAKRNVDLVDSVTSDVFSTIEGQAGCFIDGVELLEGYRILFIGDTDQQVYGKIFRVTFLNYFGNRQLSLIPDIDSDPQEGETVLVNSGNKYRGKNLYYKDRSWEIGQEKTAVNQAPLFDAFDADGNSYGDFGVYPSSSFLGTKLFSYKSGHMQDPNLGFGIAYKNIQNIGDIVFEYNLHTDSFAYQQENDVLSITLDSGYLSVYNPRLNRSFLESGWTVAYRNSVQPVIRQYTASQAMTTFFPIDVYKNSGALTDLDVVVTVNGKKQGILDYDIFTQDDMAYVQFLSKLNVGDSVIIRTVSSAPKTDNGYYEFPSNLESNPENLSLSEFTLGEITDHAKTITENLNGFIGTFPGESNLRDFSNLSQYGTKIVQHSSPLVPVVYHITDKRFNVIKALRYAKDEYSRFKRNLLRISESYGFDGDTRVHLDLILKEATKDSVKDMPYYFSDMIPFAGNVVAEHTVLDDSITEYPLMFEFSLDVVSEKAVLIYLNDQQLYYGIDYHFVNDNFVKIDIPIQTDDNLKIVQYDKTDGCYCAPTPTKLGLYPAYAPKIFIDDTYQEPIKVIQGHDGSITVAFNDFRDDIILEFEKRIYNNIKLRYNESLFDINDFVSGYYRSSQLTVDQVNSIMRQDFLQWTSLVTDSYTDHNYYDRTNEFTFNYSKFSAYDQATDIPGFWRGIYKFAYDTDRPHSHPWEMLGYSNEPAWWQDIYGPSPYTKDNLVLWQDIRDGIRREPGKLPISNLKYARPTILNHLPVDSNGGLLSPVQSGFIANFVDIYTTGNFKFGDHTPVETAWRRSSEYPFSLITSLVLLRPAAIFATCFDTIRQIKDQADQIVYRTARGNLRFNNKDLVLPSTVLDSARVHTSGLVNYIVDYIISQSINLVGVYKQQLQDIKINLCARLGGFVSKDKFKVLLDSQNPSSKGNVFLPYENYNIYLATSTPVLSISYSGVIVEKRASGFVIKGYNKTVPEFRYYAPLETSSDPIINVGGVSESFVNWTADKFYAKGKIVRYQNVFYRTSDAHSSGPLFEPKYFAKLPALPVVGGRDIIVRTRFSSDESVIHYGSELLSIQSVADFLYGYGHWLESQGFSFDFYNTELQAVTNWKTSVGEFAFWTTQNWTEGSIISLSPGARELSFNNDSAIVDSVSDGFYGHSIYRQDGNLLETDFTNSAREKNQFSLKTVDTVDGIYHVTLNLVQKEHVMVLDNVTVFNDVIYDQTQSYRQERIRVAGYRTTDWSGGFDAPGFIYDQAVVVDWKPWHDYKLGTVAKYKEFYYSANTNIPGTQEFQASAWSKLARKPESQLIPNWDYKARQYADFYDLDTDSFDEDQQKFAQHLIGYQPRQYLENIIGDNVSQYKFYQGMIRDKGTVSSFSKLFDALNSANKDSLEFFEEWAIRLGQYGASAGFDEVEYKLNESKFLINPQPIELVYRIDPANTDFVYRIDSQQVYLKSENYEHAPFPVGSVKQEYIPTAGYARLDDVQYTVVTKDEILGYNIYSLTDGDYFWIGFDNTQYTNSSNISSIRNWDIYRFTKVIVPVINIQIVGNSLQFTTSEIPDSFIKIGNIIGFKTSSEKLSKFYKITNVGSNYFSIENTAEVTTQDLTSINLDTGITYHVFKSHRIETIDSLNGLNLASKKQEETVWVDNQSNNWEVWKYVNQYTNTSLEQKSAQFSKQIVVNDSNTVLVASGNGSISYFTRASDLLPWAYLDTLTLVSSIDEAIVSSDVQDTASFGDSLSISPSADYLIVGVPGASNISGDSTSSTNEGFATLFKKSISGIYQKQLNFVSPSKSTGEFFGYRLCIIDNRVIIAAKGSLSCKASISVFELTGQLVGYYQFGTLGIEITDLSAANIERIVVGTTDDTVSVFDITATGIGLVQKLKYNELTSSAVTTGSNFATSVAITKDATLIAVGAPGNDIVATNQGSVVLYSLVNGLYQELDMITGPALYSDVQFGHRVAFNSNGDQLLVYSKGGVRLGNLTFDGGKTTFDLDTVKFVGMQNATGTVSLFDKYKNAFIFSNNLDASQILGTNYGCAVFATDRIYINDPTSALSKIYEFTSPAKSWSVVRSAESFVDIKKIKSVFLYNTTTNDIVKTLDYIDPIQGKIAGVAEQELSFKTYYDPAVYSVGSGSVVVDSLMNWKAQHIGKLWWDLSTVKFLNPDQGNALYKANTWNMLFPGSSIDIYEWVESTYIPSTWDQLADTEEGLALGISGKSKYGDAAYAVHQQFDNISKQFKPIYYFWVKNKSIAPEYVDNRNLSAKEVADYIENPKSKNLAYVALHSDTQYSLVNCKTLLSNSDVAINVRYWVIDSIEINAHSHYQLLAENDTSSSINKYIEQKWFDSLAGFDKFGNGVPDPALPQKLKYGVLSKPRQGMFVNRIEALKQFIERVNSIMAKQPVADDLDLSELNSQEPEPSVISGEIDEIVDTWANLRFVSTANKRKAKLSPIIVDGRIIGVEILDSGIGYKSAPTIDVVGKGLQARLTATIDSAGRITAVSVDNQGSSYSLSTMLTVRSYCVLVRADETSNEKWSVYELGYNLSWSKLKTQTYNTTRYWKYVDWYDTGYNAFTNVDYVVDFAYKIPSKMLSIGDTVRVVNFGAGGWILLKKISNQATLETTVNYKIIGRQRGTIEFKDNLYNFIGNHAGYDGSAYDSIVFDEQPKEELRIILNVIKSNILINNLAVEYNKLFFASLRYAFNEQTFVDWAFKTSFVRARHNLGQLNRPVVFKNDNLSDYQDYINEVKPYRTKIREFISNYEYTESTNTTATDFDLPSKYNYATNKIEPFKVTVDGAVIRYDSNEILNSPYNSWLINAGSSITEILIVNAGSKYTAAPLVEISGVCASPAAATAYISAGKITKIVITDHGSGYLTTPVVTLVGNPGLTGTPATAVAIVGNSLVRSPKIGIKFDRTSATHTVSSIVVNQEFSGTGSLKTFKLTWPADISTRYTSVTVDGIELLSTEYSVYNSVDTSASYKKHQGFLELEKTPISGSSIAIRYKKDISLLDAADRIKYFYNPNNEQLGKDLGYLMTGVDYGGVEIAGINFDKNAGWDAAGWADQSWDDTDYRYNDFYIRLGNDLQRQHVLPYVPELGELITVYWERNRTDEKFYVRIDDPKYNSISAKTSVIVALSAELDALKADQQTAQLLADEKVILKNQAQSQLDVATLARDNVYSYLQGLDSSSPEYATALTEYSNAVSEVTLAQTLLTTAQSAFAAAQAVVNNKQELVTSKQAEITEAQQELTQEGSMGNSDALMNSYIGDGIANGPIIIPSEVDLQVDDSLIVRRASSDGSNISGMDVYDTKLSGGDLAYSSAKGVTPGEIILDGDGFVTPTTSYAPEEVIPGHVVDTVDIQIYDRAVDGAPIIVTNHFLSNGTETVYPIGQMPGSLSSVFVSINGIVQKQEIDYIVDWELQSVQLLSPPLTNSDIVITSLSQNGKSIIDLDFFIGDGSTLEFITKARWTDKVLTLVMVNGEPATVNIFKTTSDYASLDNVGIRFAVAPPDGSIISYTVIESLTNSISRVQRQDIVLDGSTAEYNLLAVPEFLAPLENNMIVEVDGKILRPADTIYFTVTGNNRTFKVSEKDHALNSIDTVDMEVYVNGILKQISIDYTWRSSTNELKMKRNSVVTGDTIAMTVIRNAQYKLSNNSNIVFLESFAAGKTAAVTTFANHDILNIYRTVDIVESASSFVPNTAEYYQLTEIMGGRLKLRKPAMLTQYLWVILNGELLKPQIDYILEDNKEYITIAPSKKIKDTDVIDLIQFSNNTYRDAFGYRIFKDMLNKNNYLRINDTASTKLSQPLNYFDSSIHVEDGSKLVEPSARQNAAGVLFIDGERIEYFNKNGNVLSQLRRGTLGTGVKPVYPVGTHVRDQSTSQMIPYHDEFITNTIVYDGISLVLPLDFVPMKALIDANRPVTRVQNWINNGLLSQLPGNYIQADDIEVFIAGRRLRKVPGVTWDESLGPDSESGDIFVDAEFAVDGLSAAVRLNIKEEDRLALQGTTAIVQKRIGKSWTLARERLINSNGAEASFITAVPAITPR